MSTKSFSFKTISELSRLMEAGKMSSVELTEHCLRRIESLDASLNAFRLLCPERAIEEAKQADAKRKQNIALSPLLGIPYAAKDLFDVSGLPTSAGCNLLEAQIANSDSTVVAKLKQAGMVLLGKTNTVQFAFGGVGINHHHGTPHNPWLETPHVPGGSSSGSGVAVAAGICPMALGTDTGGSVRIPAALCGTTGLKTTVGQVSRAGVYPLSWTLDSVGPLTQTAADAALIYDAIQGADDNDPTTHGRASHNVFATLDKGIKGLKIAFAETVFWDNVDAETSQAVRSSRDAFESLGAQIRQTNFGSAEQALELNRRGLIAAAEAWTVNRDLMESNYDALDPVVATRMLNGREVSASDYLSLNREMLRLRSQVSADFTDNDVLIAPTCALPSRPIAEADVSSDEYARHNLAYLRNTSIGNVLNLCAVSVPCGFTASGLPIGLMIYARPFHEEVALRVAHAYQAATDFHTRNPNLDWITT